jgi:hypothetical protein
MPQGIRGWAVWGAAQVVISLAYRLLYKLVENALVGWGDDKIAAVVGITSPEASTVFAWGFPIALAAGTLYLYHLAQPKTVAGYGSDRSARLGLTIVSAGVLIAVIGAVVWFLETRNPAAPALQSAANPFAKNIAGPPIEWRFDKPVTIFWYARKPGEAVRIEAIVIHATNKSDFALKNVSALITADMKTAQVFTMRVNPHGTIMEPKESAKLIPPRASFDLTLGIEPNVLSADEFLQQYGTLHFTFSYEENGAKTSFTEPFSFSYLEDQIAYIEQQTREQSRVSPVMRGEPYSVKKDAEKTVIDQSVTSHNQSGGITARTVNINPNFQRALSDSIREKLEKNVPREKLVVVWATHGDQESFRYANEIFQFLKTSGFNLFGDAPQGNIFTQPLYGVTVTPQDDKTEIYIGMLSESEKPTAK